LRSIQALVNPILAELSPRFQALYSRVGRPSIPPERLLRALLLQVLYTIRSERQLMEQLDYNLLFRWFVGLNPDDAVWVPTVFTKNRDRLVEGNVADAFLHAILKAANTRGLLSHEHFTVDGTLLEAWASQKSFRPKNSPPPPPSDNDPSNPTVNFRKEKRSNTTHQSVSDPDCRLARKSYGTPALLCHLGSVLMDNRYGLIIGTDVRPPGYTAEREAGVEMLMTLEPRTRRRSIGADKGYDAAEFVAGARDCQTTPHVAQNIHARRWKSAIDARTTRHPGYEVSQVKRKLVEESFGWSKTIGGLRKLHHRGRDKVSWIFTFTNAAYNLVRMRTLIRAGVCT
jgi:transposase